MLEKLIIELGGVVPKDLLGAGLGEISHSNSGLAENSDVMTDENGPYTNNMAMTAATDNEGGVHPVTTLESGTDGGGLYGQLEDQMLQRMEQVVQDVEDEQDFRQDEQIALDVEQEKIDDIEIEMDENGVYKVFKKLSSTDQEE